MLTAILNALFILLILASASAGTALFVIARQDGSKTGRILGCVIAALSLAAGIYLVWGGHWL